MPDDCMKLSSYEPGQIVTGIDLSVFRVTARIAGPDGAVVRLADARGNPALLPADFIPINRRMAHFASMLHFHLAFNRDFDLYIRAYCEQAGLPIPVGPDGKPFRWAEWFQSTIAPKLDVPGTHGEQRDEMRDEAIHEMLFTMLSQRGILRKFEKAIKKNFPKDIKSLPVAKQLTVYLTKNFKWRIEEMNRKLREQTPPEEISMHQEAPEGAEEEELNLLETKEHARDTGEFTSVESAHDISKFRDGFYHWLKEHQTANTAKWFITLFDIYWQWISESSETEDIEGRPSYLPARRHLEPLWAERTKLSPASLYAYIGRLAQLLEQYVRSERQTLGERNIFVKLIDGIHAQRERLREEEKKPRKRKTHASAEKSAGGVKRMWEDEMIRGEQEGTICPKCGSHDIDHSVTLRPRVKCNECGHEWVPAKEASLKTARLVRGDELTPEMRKQVLDAFPYRWTTGNPHRTSAYPPCKSCDINEPFVGGSAEGHTHPTIPLKSDEEWLRDHAFHFTLDGRLMVRGNAEPAYLAGPEPNPVLTGEKVGAVKRLWECLDCGHVGELDPKGGGCERCPSQSVAPVDVTTEVPPELIRETKPVDVEKRMVPIREERITAPRREREEAEAAKQLWLQKQRLNIPLRAKKADAGDEDEEFLQEMEAGEPPEETEGEQMDREHKVCPRCLECAECNLRGCIGGGEHMPGEERSKAWEMHKELAGKQAAEGEEESFNLLDSVQNILEAHADSMLTAEDWEILREAVETASLPADIMVPAEKLLSAHEAGEPRPGDWSALAQAYEDVAGQSAEWRQVYADSETFYPAGNPFYEPLQPQTMSDTGRQPHAYKEGADDDRCESCGAEMNTGERYCEECAASTSKKASQSYISIIFNGEEEEWKAPVTTPEEWKALQSDVEELSRSNPGKPVVLVIDEEGIRTEDTWLDGKHEGETVEKESTRTESTIAKTSDGPVYPQEMQQENVRESQGAPPDAPPAPAPGTGTGTAILPVEQEAPERERRTIPPELPNKKYHMLGSEEVKEVEQLDAVKALVKAHPLTRNHLDVHPVFEHGQWWAVCNACGAIWSVEETEGATIVPGIDLDLEEVDHGDGYCEEHMLKSGSKRASTGLNCSFMEWEPGKWYYILEQGGAPKDAWDWREFADAYGPFPSFEAAEQHLHAHHAHHANPGGYSVGEFNEARKGKWHEDPVLKGLIAEAPKNMRHFGSPLRGRW